MMAKPIGRLVVVHRRREQPTLIQLALLGVAPLDLQQRVGRRRIGELVLVESAHIVMRRQSTQLIVNETATTGTFRMGRHIAMIVVVFLTTAARRLCRREVVRSGFVGDDFLAVVVVEVEIVFLIAMIVMA